MPAHRGTELVKETMQRSPLFQEDLDFPLLFHFAPGADYEDAFPLMTRWHINLYYVQEAPGQYLKKKKALVKELVVDSSTNNSSSDINKISVFGKGSYCFHGPKRSSS